jgi:hypothetical protein
MTSKDGFLTVYKVALEFEFNSLRESSVFGVLSSAA